jgi:hypothetical protein
VLNPSELYILSDFVKPRNSDAYSYIKSVCCIKNTRHPIDTGIERLVAI